MKVMQSRRKVGIVGYGAYVPRYRLPGTEIGRMWDAQETSSPPAKEKAVPGLDEDLLSRLARETRRPEAEWRRALVAPTLPRVVLGFRFKRLPDHAAQTYTERGRRKGATIRFDYVVPSG